MDVELVAVRWRNEEELRTSRRIGGISEGVPDRGVACSAFWCVK